MAGATKNGGYTGRHRRLRARWALIVAAGGVNCARCNQPIEPGSKWDLDHDPADPTRTSYLGPSHAVCNRANRAPEPAHTRAHYDLGGWTDRWSRDWFPDAPRELTKPPIGAQGRGSV